MSLASGSQEPYDDIERLLAEIETFKALLREAHRFLMHEYLAWGNSRIGELASRIHAVIGESDG